MAGPHSLSLACDLLAGQRWRRALISIVGASLLFLPQLHWDSHSASAPRELLLLLLLLCRLGDHCAAQKAPASGYSGGFRAWRHSKQWRLLVSGWPTKSIWSWRRIGALSCSNVEKYSPTTHWNHSLHNHNPQMQLSPEKKSLEASKISL